MHVAGTAIEGRYLVSEIAARVNYQAALFLRAIQFRRYLESMPMNVLGYVGVVYDGNGRRNSFFHTDQRAWRRSIVRGSGDCAAAGNFDLRPVYTQCDIGWTVRNAATLPILCTLKR